MRMDAPSGEDDLAPAGAYEAAPTEDVPVEDVRAEDARVEDEPGDSGSKDHPTDKK